MSLHDAMDTIVRMAQRGGPRKNDYELFSATCAVFGASKAAGHISDDEHRTFMRSLGPAGTRESLMGHIFHKPYGYAGDFEIIDKLYTRYRSPHPMVTRWDEFVQSVPASCSVRNRGPYLAKVLTNSLAMHSATGRPFHLVSLGSGPGRDIEHALATIGCGHSTHVRVTCVDTEARALAHSARVLADYSGLVRHVKGDVLRFTPHDRADLIWAAGLFDYFSDRAFSTVFKRLLRALAPGGQLVIGNFSERCAHHGPMSLGDWHLVCRSRAALEALARDAGVPDERLRVDAEPVGLNLLLHIQGPCE
ncbi:MAG: methyltransferase domain-containing protein [Phycisphaerales bacterium]